MSRLIITLVLFFLLGCSQNAVRENDVDKGLREFTSNWIEKLTDGDIEYCMSVVPEKRRGEHVIKLFNEQYSKISNLKVSSTVIEGYSYFKTKNKQNFRISILHDHENSWSKYLFDVEKVDNKFYLLGAVISNNIGKLPPPNSFRLSGKGIVNYMFLLGVVINLLIILVTIWFLFKTKFRRKWLWCLFIPISVFSFTLNWETGQLFYKLLQIKLLGFGIVKNGIYQPWFISISIPFGVIVFWVKFYRSNRKNTSEDLIDF